MSKFFKAEDTKENNKLKSTKEKSALVFIL